MAIHSSLLLITLLSIAFTMSSAAVITSGILGGVLSCTNTSIAIAGTYPPIANCRMDLVCGTGSLAHVINSVLTNAKGLYSFSFTAVDDILKDPTPCYLNVTIPPGSCFLNAPAGVLRISLIALATVDALVGKLLVLVPGTLSWVL